MRLLGLGLVAATFLAVGCSKVENSAVKESGSPDVAVTPAANKLVMKVPTMSCPHGCWPTVKKTLEEQSGVAGVELAAQTEEGEIDKPEVTIFYNGSFDAPAAVEALSKNGFEGAEVLN